MQLSLSAGVANSIPLEVDEGAATLNRGLKKTLIFMAESGTTDARFAWRSNVASSGALRGILLSPNAPVIIACDDLRLTQGLYFISAAGGEITWEAQYA